MCCGNLTLRAQTSFVLHLRTVINYILLHFDSHSMYHLCGSIQHSDICDCRGILEILLNGLKGIIVFTLKFYLTKVNKNITKVELEKVKEYAD